MVLRSFVKINLLFRIMDPLKRKSPLAKLVRTENMSRRENCKDGLINYYESRINKEEKFPRIKDKSTQYAHNGHINTNSNRGQKWEISQNELANPIRWEQKYSNNIPLHVSKQSPHIIKILARI